VVWGEDRVLVDGGITDNLPTGVARRLGARRVIAVDVAAPPEEIHSLAPLAVVGRAIDLVQQNTQRDPVPPDVLVLPRLDPGLTAATFPADPRPLFEIGLEAARRDLPRSPPEVGVGERVLPSPPDSLHDLLIQAPDSSLTSLARTIFAGVAPGRYDAVAVLRAMDQLYTTGLFEAVWPRVIEHPDTARAAPVLLVQLDGPPRLSLAGAAGYENDRGGRAWASLDRYSRLGRLPSVLTASVSHEGLERWASLGARLYPLNRPALAWSVGAYLREHDVRIFEGDGLRNTDVVRAGGWAGLELPHILRDRVTTAAVRTEWVHEEGGETGLSVGPLLRLTSLNPEILIVGTPVLLEAEVRWGAVSYSHFALRGGPTLGIGSLLVAGLADLRATSSAAPGDVRPALGDEQAIPGLRWGEERGRARLVAGVEAAHRILAAALRLRVRSGAVMDRISQWEEADWITGAQIAAVWRNPIAAVEWGFGVNTRGDRRFDLSVGRQF
jgi:hypothetical protein